MLELSENFRRCPRLPQNSKETPCLRICTKRLRSIMSRPRKLIGLPRSSTAATIMRAQSNNQLRHLISLKLLTNIRRRLTTKANNRNDSIASQLAVSTGPQVGAALLVGIAKGQLSLPVSKSGRASLSTHREGMPHDFHRAEAAAPRNLVPSRDGFATIESEQFAGALVAHLQGVRRCRFRNGARRSIGG